MNKPEILAAIVENAAAMLERADFAQLLGDDVAEELEENHDLQSFAERAQRHVAANIRNLRVKVAP